MTIDYLEPNAAAKLTGLRLALTRDVPAPYSMSARAILDLKGVAYTPVAQYGGRKNEDLVAWTRHRNAPVAVYNDEAPRTGWLEILNLAERLGTGPSLMPPTIDERMTMIGLTNELIGENGFIWNLRLLMLGLGGPEQAAKQAARNPMYTDYRYSETAKDQALARSKELLATFAKHVDQQTAAGSRYLIGTQLSALDVYWAYFSQLVRTLPQEQCPMPDSLRFMYDHSGAALGEFDERLIEQRDWIFEHHLSLPMTF